jgi:hypothetical protein
MLRVPVKSSNIKSIGYDAASRRLHVEFAGGAVHEYKDVSPERHSMLINAPSIGGHFHKHIRSQFESLKVSA